MKKEEIIKLLGKNKLPELHVSDLLDLYGVKNRSYIVAKFLHHSVYARQMDRVTDKFFDDLLYYDFLEVAYMCGYYRDEYLNALKTFPPADPKFNPTRKVYDSDLIIASIPGLTEGVVRLICFEKIYLEEKSIPISDESPCLYNVRLIYPYAMHPSVSYYKPIDYQELVSLILPKIHEMKGCHIYVYPDNSHKKQYDNRLRAADLNAEREKRLEYQRSLSDPMYLYEKWINFLNGKGNK